MKHLSPLHRAWHQFDRVNELLDKKRDALHGMVAAVLRILEPNRTSKWTHVAGVGPVYDARGYQIHMHYYDGTSASSRYIPVNIFNAEDPIAAAKQYMAEKNAAEETEKVRKRKERAVQIEESERLQLAALRLKYPGS